MTGKFKVGDWVFDPNSGLRGVVMDIYAERRPYTRKPDLMVQVRDDSDVIWKIPETDLVPSRASFSQAPAGEIAEIVMENRRLRDRVDELLRANNDLVEQRHIAFRECELARRQVERLQREIAPKRQVYLDVRFDTSGFARMRERLRHRYFHLGAEADA